MSDDDFLSRWSRRKRRPDATPATPVVPPVEEPVAEQPEETDEEILARLGLKHPDEMGPGDDFGAFVRAAVPRHLKTLAYRRLWRSNPTLACVDGLNDYDGDFTGTGVPEGGLKTAYQVGRGLLGRIAKVAENHGTDVPQEPSGPEDVVTSVETTSDAGSESRPEVTQNPEIVQQNDTPRTTRRRMVFRARG